VSFVRAPSIISIPGNLGMNPLSILSELLPDVVAFGYDQRVSGKDIKAVLPGCEVVRLKPFHPDLFKSSLYRLAG
jgi:hypothetical protein